MFYGFVKKFENLKNAYQYHFYNAQCDHLQLFLVHAYLHSINHTRMLQYIYIDQFLRSIQLYQQ